MDLLEKDDSIMADRGFDILEDLAPRGVRINIPPYHQKWRKASLRIHIERCMECLENYHIFDGVMPLSLMDVANQIFFVCAVLIFICA